MLTMRTNQKYFACDDDEGQLATGLRLHRQHRRERRRRGDRRRATRKVLAARLSDARFFWEQDLKVPLDEQAKKLDQIVFHEKLGTVADKVERVAKLARWLVEERLVRAPTAEQAERAARLAKADLVTEHGRRVPRAAGRDRRLSRARAGRAGGGRRRDPRPLQAGGTMPTLPVRSPSRWPTGSTRSPPSSRSTRSRPDRRIRSRCAALRSAISLHRRWIAQLNVASRLAA